jgi:hypothetical protein
MTYFNQESDQRLSRQEAFSNSFVTSRQEDEVENKRDDLRKVRVPLPRQALRRPRTLLRKDRLRRS